MGEAVSTSYEPLRDLISGLRDDIRELRADMNVLEGRLMETNRAVVTREEFDEHINFRRTQGRFFIASMLTLISLVIGAVSVIIATR